MRRLRFWIRATFGFSRNETNGFLILLPLMIVILFSNSIYQWLFTQPADPPYLEATLLDSLLAEIPEEPSSNNQYRSQPPTMFAFNPNNCTREDLIALGLKGWLADRIIKYRSKGGKFRVKSDLLKIYGLDSTIFRRLQAYVLLPDTLVEKKSLPRTASKASTSQEKFSLNQADTLQLKTIYGIGSVRSRRIVAYRNLLGGFVKPDQLYEVWGMDSVVVEKLINQSFITESFQPIRLNINHATEPELARHPYISTKMAHSIVAYRFQHGTFNRIDDLLRLELVDSAQFERFEPYLSVE